MKKIQLQYVAMSLMLLSAFWLMLPRGGHEWDTRCWTEWACAIFRDGISKVYHTSTDYVPLIHYIFAFFGWIQGNEADIKENLPYLKVITLVFHFLTGYFLLRLLVRYAPAGDNHIFTSLFYLCNFSILYNAVIWNQVDIILACFIFAGIYYALQEKVLSALLMLVLALNFKILSIIFVPVFGLLLLPPVIRTFTFRRLFLWTASIIALQTLIILPFLADGTAYRILDVISGSVDKFEYISISAYNVWYLLVDCDLMGSSDKGMFGIFNYKHWGLFAFFSFSFLALWPLLRGVIGYMFRRPHTPVGISQTLIICSLIPLLFFYLNTQMHERYSHTALVFMTTYAIITRRALPAIIGCLAYGLNLENELMYFGFGNYGTLVFDRIFISALYGICIVLLFIDLYSNKLSQANKQQYEKG